MTKSNEKESRDERNALFRVGDVLLVPEEKVHTGRVNTQRWTKDVEFGETREVAVLVTAVDLSAARAEYVVIGADGYSTSTGGHLYSWDSEHVRHVEGATSRYHVVLPPEWQQRAIDYDKSQLASPDGVAHEKKVARDYSETHPSYGSARVSRVSGQSNLFMSAFAHQHFITLGISRAELTRSQSNQWLHSALGSDLIELAFSESQWALLLSSVGGSGVPTTIKRLHGKLVQECPPQANVGRFHADVEERMARATEHLAQAVTKAREVAEAPSATKGDRRDVAAAIQAAQRELFDGLPFVVEMLRERMETIVDEAKAQVELHLRLAQGERTLAAGAPVAAPSEVLSPPVKELP